METTGYADKFKTNLLDTFDLISEIFEECKSKGFDKIDPSIIRMAAGYVKISYQPDQLIDGFIKNTHDIWDQIKEKDEDFFKKNITKTFSGIGNGLVDKFSPSIISAFESVDDNGNPYIDFDDREDIWVHLSSLVKLCLRYILEKRDYGEVTTEEGVKKVFRARYMDKIHLKKEFVKWDMTME